MRLVFRLPIILAALLLPLIGPGQAHAITQTFETRPGVTVRAEVNVPDDAPAMVLLFEGAGGALSADSKGFAHRARQIFLGAGLATVLVGPPSDQRSFKGGMSPRFRTSDAHITDIDAVVAAITGEHHLPVWILGMSMGSRSAAYYAVRRSQKIGGVVLVSSMTKPPRGKPIQALQLHKVTVPLLAVAHEDDECPSTPAAGAQEIIDAATKSRAAEAKLFSGGQNIGGNPCEIETHHTFFGIEKTVGSAIANFIMDNTR